MIPLSLHELVNAVEGQLVADVAFESLVIKNIVTDSRIFNDDNTVQETAFLALKGQNFDAHRFVEQVINNGCSVVIVEHEHEFEPVENIAQIIVEDTRIALGKIAAYVKAQVAPKTVGITGSTGKTTVKEMVAAILFQRGNVLATAGNFNNDIGVPLTLLRLEKSHEFAVIEMGANHLGEIAYTTELVKPDVAVINNIAAAHLEGFGDLCGVARAKGEIFAGLNDGGVAIYNKESKYASKWQWRLTDKKVKTFSCFNPIGADCYSSGVHLDSNGCASFKLHTLLGECLVKLSVPGKHNVCNAVSAACVAVECGASLDDICVGLAQMIPIKGRLNIHQLANVKLIDDSYNASVESVKAAIQLLSSYSGKQILILGDMGELGSEARGYHQEIGEYAQYKKIDLLLSAGVLSQTASDAYKQLGGQKSCHFSGRSQLLDYLLTNLNQNSITSEQPITILVKGSRSAHMEYVVQEIINWHESKIKNSQLEEDHV
ncbi:MAG: UDP-N-acetylmuramoyl-tripeptide--D-alanyl-D-alanine ligase [Colwellia sp.]